MSGRFKWAGVEDCPINLYDDAWLRDHGGDMLDVSGVALVLGDSSGAGALVIEAERPDQLVEFARTILRMCEDMDNAS